MILLLDLSSVLLRDDSDTGANLEVVLEAQTYSVDLVASSGPKSQWRLLTQIDLSKASELVVDIAYYATPSVRFSILFLDGFLTILQSLSTPRYTASLTAAYFQGNEVIVTNANLNLSSGDVALRRACVPTKPLEYQVPTLDTRVQSATPGLLVF